MNECILITGANAGLGKETARQFALKNETRKVILFCRNRARAEAAKKDLEEQTGKEIFAIVIGDVTDEDVPAVVES
jgi:short-subunit dehydrogenase